LEYWLLSFTPSVKLEKALKAVQSEVNRLSAEIDWVDTALSRDGHVTAFDANKAGILDKLSPSGASRRSSVAAKF